MRRYRMLLGAALGVALVAGTWITVSGANAVDPGVAACQRAVKSGTVGMSFSIARGSDIYAHIPRLGRSPELEDDSPVSVVVFKGTVDVGPVAGRAPAPGEVLPRPSSTYSGVVCVYHKGIPELYSGVDTAGATP